jgi:erythromycin esterase
MGAEDGFAKWAADHARLLTTVEPGGDESDLLPIQAAIGTARIVGLGEPTHGAHEPLAFRNRLFRSLVERKGFSAIALELGFTESINARAFIERGEGDAGTAARKGLGSGLSRYPENIELIQWMRDYNATAASRGHRKLHLYGVDLTTGGRKHGPWLAIDSALTYLSRADPATAQKIRDAASPSLSGIDGGRYGSLPADAQAQFEASIEAIAKAMHESRKPLIARSSAEDYRWALHNLDAARQLAKCLPITPLATAGMDLWARASACREISMAENVQWALKNEGRQGRILVFAAGSHVMGAKEDGRRMANVQEKPPMMGFNLRRKYGNDLYIILMVTSNISGFQVPTKTLEEGSIESTLARVGLPLMFLDVRTAQQDKGALVWLSIPRSLMANISSQALIPLSSAVDAFVFADTLTPARSRSR